MRFLDPRQADLEAAAEDFQLAAVSHRHRSEGAGPPWRHLRHHGPQLPDQSGQTQREGRHRQNGCSEMVGRLLNLFFFFLLASPSVHLSSQASEEEEQQLGGGVHRRRLGGGRLEHQQGLPASKLPVVSQAPGATGLLPKPLAAGLLQPHQGEDGG